MSSVLAAIALFMTGSVQPLLTGVLTKNVGQYWRTY